MRKRTTRRLILLVALSAIACAAAASCRVTRLSSPLGVHDLVRVDSPGGFYAEVIYGRMFFSVGVGRDGVPLPAEGPEPDDVGFALP